MRIAVSGAHHTGKTTLISELGGLLPAFRTVEEPYYLLEEEGHTFAEMPSLEDFETQLERSIESIVQNTGDCLFDRCPCDMLAYMIDHEESQWIDINQWLPRIQEVMQQIDLVIFVPIEDPDRMTVTESDHIHLRQRVDEELRKMVLEDQWTLGVPAIEVTGSLVERAAQVLVYLGHNLDPGLKAVRPDD